MRILAYVGYVVISTALVTAAGFVLALQTPRPDGSLGLAIAAVFVFVFGPLTLGAMTAYGNPGRSAAPRRSMRRSVLVVVGLEALAAVAIATYAVISGAPLWIPVSFTAGGVVLTAIAVLVGRAVSRSDDRRRTLVDPAWVPLSASEIRTKATTIVLSFAITLVITLLGAFIFSMLLGGDDGGAIAGPVLVALALQIAFLAGALAAIIAVMPLDQRLRDVGERDADFLRALRRIVSGEEVASDDRHRRAAARYAALFAVIQPFYIVFFTLLYAGISTQQVSQLVSGNPSLFAVVLLVVLAIVWLALVPVVARRAATARRYAREHRDALEN